MKKPKSDYVIQTVTHALALLEAFEGEEELGVTELARRLDLHKNNVFRLLATLEEKGYIEQDPGSERYRLGVRCLEIGQSFSRNRSLVRHARPHLENLVRETGESAHLAVLRDFHVVYLDGEPSAQLVRAASRSGERLPAHCTAAGKVLLGCADDRLRQEFDRLWVAAGRLERRTRATILDREKLFEAFRAAAGQRYALDDEECEVGMRCAAAPVYEASGRSVAALVVSGPSYRLETQRLLDQVVPALSASAERLSGRLGYLT
ncbi:MAG: IclR family transcriptional regulator [Deltaproteobacteria bacterium]|nr:MAG: IclR family transcriptional regulator [Deltaproteobacteria bacterium]